MQNLPLSDFGFTYNHNGKQYSFVVTAHSAEEAQARAAAMGNAEFFGLLQSDSLTDAPNVGSGGWSVEYQANQPG